MTSLADIRKAKEIGKSVRKTREAQCLSIQAVAKLSGLSTNQMVNLENGNFFAFNQDLNQLMSHAKHSAEMMGVDLIDTPGEMPAINSKMCSLEESIPVFLQKIA
jgi:transcriptional regulator with XRE-family HTH domain